MNQLKSEKLERLESALQPGSASLHSFEPAKPDSALRHELLDGEQVLWSGSSDPRRMNAVFTMWLFAIPWTLFSLLWEGTALLMMLGGLVNKDPNFTWWLLVFPIFGLPFVGIGFWMMNKPLAALADARHQIHALTNRRLVTLTLRKDKTFHSVDLRHTGPIRRKEKSDGFGELTIETGSHVDSYGNRVTERFEMYGIADVAQVERLLRNAQEALRPGPALATRLDMRK
jgi:hypothetical protein